MRVALFGGTFDPVHRGHLAIARAAADAFGLDLVLFAPVGRQPLKPESATASFADRVAMVAIACEAEEESSRFAVSTIDAPNDTGTPNYTVDSLDTLAREYPEATLFVLVGADSFLNLRRWREPDRLLALGEWIVVSRPDFPIAEARVRQLAPNPEQRARIHLLTSVQEDVSASKLRRRLRLGDPCIGLILPKVLHYIEAHRLYR